VSNYSTGDLLESQGSSTDSDSDSGSSSDSNSESEFDNRPTQKKQKPDNSQHGSDGESPAICQIE